MSKGFTLVELLAVIVILAVLALIATPVVLSIIDDAKESSMLRSAEMYLSGVENAVMRENMNSGGNFRPNECTITSGNMTCGSTNVEVEVDGEVPSSGTITFENGKIKEVTLKYTSGTIVKDANGNLVYEGSQSNSYVSLGKAEHKLPDGTVEAHDMSSGTCSLCGETELVGVYYLDGSYENWETMINYGFATETTIKNSFIFEKFLEPTVINKLIMPDTIITLENSALDEPMEFKEVIFSENITKIGYNAFRGLRMKTMVWPKKTNIIENWVFMNSAIETLTLHKNITSIGMEVFSDSNLTTINYDGTKAEWNAIEKDSLWNEGCSEITVHCIDGDIIIPAWGIS